MKVVHVVRQFAPGIGGLEEAAQKLCLALAARGVAPSVVTLDRIVHGDGRRLPQTEVVAGVPVRRIPFRGSWRYPLAPAVLAAVAEADVVHVHAIDFFFDVLAATKPVHRKPLVASTHGGFFHTGFAHRLKALYFQTVTRASAAAYDRLCASSESDLTLFRRIASRNLVRVDNGVDVEKWGARGAAAPTRTMIAIGRLSANKQVEALFPILGALRAAGHDWRLIVAGQPWDVPVAALRARAAAAGIADHVEIHPAPSDAALGDLIARASFIVSASRHEGFGIGIVEGLSAGLVPLLNRIPAFESLIRLAPDGCLFDAAEPSAAARAITEAHARLERRPDAVRQACMMASRGFGWGAAAESFVHHYEAVLRARQPSRLRPTEEAAP